VADLEIQGGVQAYAACSSGTIVAQGQDHAEAYISMASVPIVQRQNHRSKPTSLEVFDDGCPSWPSERPVVWSMSANILELRCSFKGV
jgi:hypothetical protein